MNRHAEHREAPRPAYEILSNPEVRKALKKRVGELMDQIEAKRVDTVVFLDRSARPISWLMREMWKRRKTPAPEMKYMNIGYATRTAQGGHEVLEPDGETDKVGYGDSSLPRSTQNRARNGEWISLEDVPAKWQRGLVDHAATLEVVEKAFGNSLDGKRVLVLDEFVGTGKSLLAAIGILSLTCPRTEDIHGTGVFASELTGIESDRKKLPWLRVPGMTGVLELPEKLFFSGPITQQSVEQVRERIAQAHEEEFAKYEDEFRELAGAMRRVASDLNDRELLATLDDRQAREGIVRVLPEALESLEAGLTARRFDNAWQLHGALRELSFVFGGLQYGRLSRLNDSSDVRTIAHLTDKFESEGVVELLGAMSDHMMEIDYEGTHLLKERAEQLREEMRLLGQEQA